MAEINTALPAPEKKLTTRRGFLKLLGAAAAGAASGIFFGSEGKPQQAAAGDRSIAGAGNPEVVKKRIWEQIVEPSKYAVHVLRGVDGLPDINLEKMQIPALIFWPKDVIPQNKAVHQSVEELLKTTASFWQRALDNKTTIRTELIVGNFIGQKTRVEYGIGNNGIIPELRELVRNQVKDPKLQSRIQYMLEKTQNGDRIEDFPEFTNLQIFVVGPDTNYTHSSGGNLGVIFINTNVESILNWRNTHLDNLVAHEAGHGFGLPDQYVPASEWWYDPDPENIMGPNMWNIPLSQALLAQSVKKWVLNKKLDPRIMLPFVANEPVLKKVK